MIEMTEASDDIFSDLGFPPDEALNLKLRADLMIDIKDGIKAIGLTQAEIADKLGVTQSRISDLINGKIDRFSLDTLVNFAAKLGCKVDLTVTPRAA